MALVSAGPLQLLHWQLLLLQLVLTPGDQHGHTAASTLTAKVDVSLPPDGWGQQSMGACDLTTGETHAVAQTATGTAVLHVASAGVAAKCAKLPFDVHVWLPVPGYNFQLKTDDGDAPMSNGVGSALTNSMANSIESAEVATPWRQDRFAISFFAQTHKPPIDDASFQLMRDGNFTAVGLFDHLGANKPDAATTALQQRLCEKYGLKCLLSLDNFKEAKNGSRMLPQVSPTQWGFYLADEPNAHEFPSLQKDVAAVRAEAPGSMSFINLLPCNVSGEGHGDNPSGWAHEWGAANYSDYAQQLVDVVKPDVVCFDHYPVFHSDPTVTGKTKCRSCRDSREDYIRNLELAGAVAHRAKLPLWLYFNIVPYRRLFLGDPTEAQIRWQISIALAYGATGLLYFEWHPMSDGHPGLVMTVDGPPVPSPHFFQAKRLNSWVLAMEPTLLQAVSTATLNLRYEDQNVSYSALGVARSSGLRNISRGDWTLGFFDLPQSSSQVASAALLLVNFEHAYIEWATVEWQDVKTVSEISGHSGQPVAVVDDAPDAPGFQLRFEPGQGRLFVFANSTALRSDDAAAAVAIGPRSVYVATDGNDAAAGDAAHPWRSLAKLAALRLRPGDSIHLRAGDEWREPLVLHGAGGGAGLAGCMDHFAPAAAGKPEGWLVGGWALDCRDGDSSSHGAIGCHLPNGSAPLPPVQVSIQVDGIEVGSAMANLSRPDLQKAGAAPDPLHGFNVHVQLGPKYLRGQHRIAVRSVGCPSCAGTGWLLPGGAKCLCDGSLCPCASLPPAPAPPAVRVLSTDPTGQRPIIRLDGSATAQDDAQWAIRTTGIASVSPVPACPTHTRTHTTRTRTPLALQPKHLLGFLSFLC